MKNYRTLFPIILTVLMIVSIYSMISGANAQKKEIDLMLKKAESYAGQELYDKAADVYNEILIIENRVEYYLDVIDMYYDAADYEDSESWCKIALNKYPKEASVYERCMRVYIKQEAYSDAYSIVDEFDGRELSSEKMGKYKKSIEYVYQETPILYDEVLQPSSGYANALDDEKWGTITVQGKRKVKTEYDKLGFFANELLAVCDAKGTWYFMNENNEYVYNISKSVGGKVTDVGLYNEELVSVCVDGLYTYYNLNFEKKLDSYEYAGTFNGGVAAVKQDGKWKLINTSGESITKKTYEDIILDERGICCTKDRIFVKSGEEYIMVDKTGKRIGQESFESAKIFSSEDCAAIMRGDLWGFVDISGKTIIEPQYQDAKSFSMGLAAVCDDNLWGYINVDGDEIIDLQFKKALTFSSSGTVFVQDINDSWKLFKLYKYNH